MNKSLWNGKPWQAFKTFAILFSFTMNFILLIVLLIVAPLIMPIVNDIAKPIVGGLSDSFVQMGSAKIVRTVPVNDQLPIAFTLPLSATTNVVLSEDVPLTGVPAQFNLPGGGGTINGQVALTLPKGVVLPVQLKLDVAVEQEIPVALNVQVEIPLSETELGTPFNNLKALFQPIDTLLDGLPSSNGDLINRLMGGKTSDAPQPTPTP